MKCPLVVKNINITIHNKMTFSSNEFKNFMKLITKWNLSDNIGNLGGSGVKISYIIFKCRSPPTPTRYTNSDIFIENQIRLQSQQTYQNPILNSGLKSSWVQILLTYPPCPNF